MTQFPKRMVEQEQQLRLKLGSNLTSSFPISIPIFHTTPKMDLTTEEGVKQYLRSNLYSSCRKVERLPEGFGGFVFRAHNDEKEQPSSVIFKHVEPYAARAQSWKLDQSRLVCSEGLLSKMPS